MITLPLKADSPGQVSTLTGIPQPTDRMWDLPFSFYYCYHGLIMWLAGNLHCSDPPVVRISCFC